MIIHKLFTNVQCILIFGQVNLGVTNFGSNSRRIGTLNVLLVWQSLCILEYGC